MERLRQLERVQKALREKHEREALEKKKKD